MMSVVRVREHSLRFRVLLLAIIVVTVL